MKCMDLVVTSDTGVAHLAGGLAVSTWLALHSDASGAGCATARILPGIPPCGCFGSLRPTTGPTFSTAWLPS